jgi:hypothetical protein
MSEICVSIITYLLTKLQTFLTVNIVISSMQYSSKRSIFVRVLFLIRVRSNNEAYNQCRQNIVFQHPVALMYHLYRFTSILNATLYTITPLLKYKNYKLKIATCFGRTRQLSGNSPTVKIVTLYFQCN